MRIVFWQNILSDHQCDLIQYVHQRLSCEVYLAYELDDSRGWQSCSPNITAVVDSRDEDTFSSLTGFRSYDDIHVFSGFNIYPRCSLAHKILSRTNAKLIVMSEAFEENGIPGLFRSISAHLKYRLLSKRVDRVFAIGAKARDQFLRHGIDSSVIVDFAYYLKPYDDSNKHLSTTTQKTYDILFIGQLIKRKNVLFLLNVFLAFYKVYNATTLTIVGCGPLRQSVKAIVARYPHLPIRLIDGLQHEEALSLLSNSSVLVLPSRWDGWGAVVSEALLVNTPVICSTEVGASSLICKPSRGIVFTSNSSSSLYRALKINYSFWLNSGRNKPRELPSDPFLCLDTGATIFIDTIRTLIDI